MEQRLTQAEYRGRMEEIRRALADHIGRKVLLIAREGRGHIPVIATLERAQSKIYGVYKHYTKDGVLSGRRTMYVNPALIHTGELQVVYFDDGI